MKLAKSLQEGFNLGLSSGTMSLKRRMMLWTKSHRTVSEQHYLMVHLSRELTDIVGAAQQMSIRSSVHHRSCYHSTAVKTHSFRLIHYRGAGQNY